MTNVVGLSYRDGMTFQDMLYAIRDYVNKTLRDSITEEHAAILAQLNEYLAAYHADIVATKEQWETVFNAYMEDVDASLQALNDVAVTNLVNNTGSNLRGALDVIFAKHADMVEMRGDFDQFVIDSDTRFTDFEADVNVELAKFVPKSSLMANVRDFGAVGNGTTDDTAAVQRAVDSLAPSNGGRLFFPQGDYYLRNAVFIIDNLEIFGAGATLRKIGPTGPTYCLFIGSSGSQRGYGAGPSNIYVHDLSIRGKFGANAYAVNVLALHHSDNVVVERLDIQEASGNGHRFDLQGCRYVTIRDNVFRGFDGSMGSLYNEDIQPDYSTKRSGSFLEADVNCYDALPTIHVTVENNQWLPLTIGGFTYPAANPFGTHGTNENIYVSDLVFKGNTVTRPIDDTGNVVPGSVSMVGVRNVLIENNTFIGTNNPSCPAIAFYQGTGGGDPNQAHTDAPSIAYAFPMRCENIVVRGNNVEGYHKAPSIIRVHGSTESRAFDVEVSDNHLRNTNASSGAENSGPLTIDLNHCQRVKVSGNTVRHSRRLAVLSNCHDVNVVGNNSSSNSLNDLTVIDSNRVAINGNVFNGVRGYGVYVPASNGVAIVGNTMASINESTAPLVQVSDTPQFTFVGNTLTGFNASAGFYAHSSGGAVVGNVFDGFATPVNPAATVGNITVTGNALV